MIEPRGEDADGSRPPTAVPTTAVGTPDRASSRPAAASRQLIGFLMRCWSRINWGTKRQNVTILSCALLIAVCKLVFDRPDPPASSSAPPTVTEHYDPLDLRDNVSLKLGAEKVVEQRLRDPDSATFSDEKVMRASGGYATRVCGSVNSRNGFGGMAGAQRFVVGKIVILEEQETSADFVDLWAKLC